MATCDFNLAIEPLGEDVGDQAVGNVPSRDLHSPAPGSSKTASKDMMVDKKKMVQTLSARCRHRDLEHAHSVDIPLSPRGAPVSKKIQQYQTKCAERWKKHKTNCLWAFSGICLLAYSLYFGWAMAYDFQMNISLLVLTTLTYVLCLQHVIRLWYGERLSRRLGPCTKWLANIWKKYLRFIMLALVVLGLMVFVAVDITHRQPKRLVSAVGLIVYTITSFFFSKSPAKVPWRSIGAGLLLQVFLGLFIIRLEAGAQTFQWVGHQATAFLAYTDVGCRFVFGANFTDHLLIFQVLMVVIYFGAVVSVLYYLNIIQRLIRVLGRLLSFVMEISPAETFVAAANIFVGPNTSVLTVAPLLAEMTQSELHCVMTSGFATVSGSLLGAYAGFGVPISHLISASVMSAPAALVTAKLFYPDTVPSKMANTIDIKFPKSEGSNAIEAYAAGAMECVKIVSHIAVNLIAFVSFMAMFNSCIDWLGHRVGISGLSFELISSYIFVPLPVLMGIDIADCRQVSRLIGTKLVLSDIVGYSELGVLIRNRKSGRLPAISPRSEVIATYALCGFGNFVDVGICLGAIGAIVPSRQADLAQVALRAMVAGNVACFITACMAGFLYKEP